MFQRRVIAQAANVVGRTHAVQKRSYSSYHYQKTWGDRYGEAVFAGGVIGGVCGSTFNKTPGSSGGMDRLSDSVTGAAGGAIIGAVAVAVFPVTIGVLGTSYCRFQNRKNKNDPSQEITN